MKRTSRACLARESARTAKYCTPLRPTSFRRFEISVGDEGSVAKGPAHGSRSGSMYGSYFKGSRFNDSKQMEEKRSGSNSIQLYCTAVQTNDPRVDDKLRCSVMLTIVQLEFLLAPLILVARIELTQLVSAELIIIFYQLKNTLASGGI